MRRDAVFDATGRYRYWLWRCWDEDLPCLGFVMLNPNRADATIDDPTVRRCLGFAKSWNYGAIAVVNLFAYCTPYPRELRQIADPVGMENDHYLTRWGQRTERLILAWGNGGRLLGRDRTVLNLLAHHPQLYCLGKTQQQQPKHPLYLKKDTSPQRIHAPAESKK
jgi:hypothetical protein